MNNPVLMVVDDEPEIVDFVRDAAEEFGFAVDSAKDGRDCISRMMHSHPNVLLLDVMMPDMDGVELVRQLADRNMPLPIIVMSGNEQFYMQIIEMIARQSGIEILGTLNKPFHVAQLETCLKPVLGEMVN
jgi:two-component system alkaline phosphatase synthesis response regulator PhoP